LTVTKGLRALVGQVPVQSRVHVASDERMQVFVARRLITLQFQLGQVVLRQALDLPAHAQ
jgi:hypothetical protein